MTEIEFLVSLLMNEKLDEALKTKILQRIVEVDKARAVNPNTWIMPSPVITPYTPSTPFVAPFGPNSSGTITITNTPQNSGVAADLSVVNSSISTNIATQNSIYNVGSTFTGLAMVK